MRTLSNNPATCTGIASAALTDHKQSNKVLLFCSPCSADAESRNVLACLSVRDAKPHFAKPHFAGPKLL